MVELSAEKRGSVDAVHDGDIAQLRQGNVGVRVSRFAPTPSGRMHLGNIIAMLAAWLSVHAASAGDSSVDGTSSHSLDVGYHEVHEAQTPHGIVRLRIEDLDTARMLPDADRWIMDDLDWLGLDWDGEPVYQSQRTERYAQALAALAPDLYPCFCSRSDIRAASAPQQGDGFTVYPGTCRRLLREQPQMVQDKVRWGLRHSLRLALPDASDPRSVIEFDDLVFGRSTWNLARDIGDPVVRRSDGVFAYQLAVAVDDLDMGVTSIVRGRDLLTSTALQLWIRALLNEAAFHAANGQARTLPRFAHIPLLDDADGHRLAKREHSADIGALRSHGFSARQIIGYCAWLLGVRVTDEHRRFNDQPVEMTPSEAAELFTWEPLRRDHRDRTLGWG